MRSPEAAALQIAFFVFGSDKLEATRNLSTNQSAGDWTWPDTNKICWKLIKKKVYCPAGAMASVQ